MGLLEKIKDIGTYPFRGTLLITRSPIHADPRFRRG